MSTPKLLTGLEVASRLGVHPDTVRRWGSDGQLSWVRLPGGHQGYPETEIEAILAREEGLVRADRGGWISGPCLPELLP